MNRKPIAGAIVIGQLSPDTRSKVEKLPKAHIAEVREVPGAFLVEAKSGSARAFWEKVNSLVGSEGVVSPILKDGEGNRLVPNGRVQVKFKTRPTDAHLTRFARRHRVDLTRRSTWSPHQAEFALRTDDRRYPPDVARDLAADTEVATAWPDVLAAFERVV